MAASTPAASASAAAAPQPPTTAGRGGGGGGGGSATAAATASAAAGAASGSAPGASKRSEESVCVAVNIRPLIEIELEQGCQECLSVAPGLPQVSAGPHTYTYDHVFGGDFGDDLGSLYPKCVRPLLDGLFKGYNATVFAYGERERARARAR